MENGLVPAGHLEPGLIPRGYAETVLAHASTLDDPAVLWDGATGFEALAKKRQGQAHEQLELRRAALYCEVLLAQLLGPNPGTGGDHKSSAFRSSSNGNLIPPPLMS